MVVTLATLLLFSSLTSHALFIPFNASILPLSATLPSPFSPAFLKEVVKEIAAKERWDPDGEVRVSEFDAESARVGDAQRYEFHVRVGRMVLVMGVSEVASWRKQGRGSGFGPDPTAGGTGRAPAVAALELGGPLDLHVGGGDDELSLLLPAMNIRHKGLRRVFVGDGITIKVEGAQEVSLIHPYGISLASLALNKSLDMHNDDRKQFWPLSHSSCAPLLSVRVVGSASLVAYWTRNSEAYLQTAFQSHDTIELLPEKCYKNGQFKPIPSSSFGPLHSRLALLEERLQSFVGYRLLRNRSTRFLKAKITTSTLIKFRVELERDITEDDRIWKKVAEWRTKPVVERHLFEIVTRVEGGRGLKPLIVKKLKSPFLVVDSTAWSNLMSNISFTQFPSVVVPPEALTLDVKW